MVFLSKVLLAYMVILLQATLQMMVDIKPRLERVYRVYPHAGTGGKSNRSEGALDMTPSFMYYSVARVWLEHLIGGQDEAEKVMRECLDLAQGTMMPTETSRTGGISAQHGRNLRLGETIAGERCSQVKVAADRGGHTLALYSATNVPRMRSAQPFFPGVFSIR